MHMRLSFNKAISRQGGPRDAVGCQSLRRDNGNKRQEQGQRERTGRRGCSERTEGGGGTKGPGKFPVVVLTEISHLQSGFSW